MPFVVFPEKKMEGVLNFLSVPEEVPTREVISWPGEYDVAGITI